MYHVRLLPRECDAKCQCSAVHDYRVTTWSVPREQSASDLPRSDHDAEKRLPQRYSKGAESRRRALGIFASEPTSFNYSSLNHRLLQVPKRRALGRVVSSRVCMYAPQLPGAWRRARRSMTCRLCLASLVGRSTVGFDRSTIVRWKGPVSG